MTGRVLVLLTRSLLAAATTLAVLATPASATAEGSDGLSGEVLTLDLGGLLTCAEGATSYSFTATGDATGPVAGPVEATISTEVADGSRVSTIVFSVNGGELQGTQTASGLADDSGACAPPVDGTWGWSGTVGVSFRHRHRHARLRRRPAHRHPDQPGAAFAVTDRHAERHAHRHADGHAQRHADGPAHGHSQRRADGPSTPHG